MDPDVWLNANDGNDNIHHAVPQDNLICSGISEYDPVETWPEHCISL